MSDHANNRHEMVGVKTIRAHQFITLIVLAIMIALFMVYVAMSLYNSSGALQLDLSRPGYADARQEATKGYEVFRGFDADGQINEATLNEFDKLYKEKAAQALIEFDAFSGEALSDEALRLDRD